MRGFNVVLNRFPKKTEGKEVFVLEVIFGLWVLKITLFVLPSQSVVVNVIIGLTQLGRDGDKG